MWSFSNEMWLGNERGNTMNLSKKEYCQLEAIHSLCPNAKYVARDNCSTIWAYFNKPFKCGDFWRGKLAFLIPSDNLPSLAWDSEPLSIDGALKVKKTQIDEKPERVGKWLCKQMAHFSYYFCSECSAWALYNYHDEFVKSAYCPHCGVKMEG